MAGIRCKITSGLLFASLLLASGPAFALTLAAPLGGNAFVVPSRHVVCDGNAELNGWRLEAQGSRTKVRPPPRGGAATTVLVKTAASQIECQQAPETLTLHAVADWPTVQAGSVVVNVDLGRLDLSGLHLKNVALGWRIGDRQGEDVCREPQLVGGFESCAFSIERGLGADPGEMALTLMPLGLRADADVLAFDGRGRKVPPARFMLTPNKIVLVDLVAPEASLDAENDIGRLPLRHPEAIDRVTCRGAACELDGRDLVVRGVRTLEESLEVRATLRPHVFVQGASQLLSAPLVVVPLQHCPISLVSAPPLRGTAGQRLVVAVGGRCEAEPNLRYFVGGSQARVMSTHKQEGKLYAVLQTDVALGADITVVVQRRNAVVGMARGKTRMVPSARSQVTLPGHGAIDFIPSNRSAEVMLPTLSDGGMLVPIAVPGVYTVSVGAEGGYRIQGIVGATGWVALRLAYRDNTLPAPLRDTNLAELTDSVDRNIHPASIPMTLGNNTLGEAPIVELQCTDRAGTAHKIAPAQPVSISFQQKDSCRLVLHRERLEPEDGDQLVQVTVRVAAMNGLNRPEAAVDQRVLMRPGKEPRYLYLNGVLAPFDRMVVRVAVITEDLHDSVAAIGQAERINLAQVQWALTVGNNPLRLYATTSMPTGLFRVADKGHSGLLGLNAGILTRLVMLTRTGTQAPIALELGVMVLGIAGDTTPAPNGHVAAVGGLSLSVPIANVSQTTQAAISLHAWAEYEVSRAFLDGSGSPWGFVFGPSLSFGNVGLNL